MPTCMVQCRARRVSLGPSWTQLDLAADLAIDISHSAELVELHVCFWERPKAREKSHSPNLSYSPAHLSASADPIQPRLFCEPRSWTEARSFHFTLPTHVQAPVPSAKELRFPLHSSISTHFCKAMAPSPLPLPLQSIQSRLARPRTHTRTDTDG